MGNQQSDLITSDANNPQTTMPIVVSDDAEQYIQQQLTPELKAKRRRRLSDISASRAAIVSYSAKFDPRSPSAGIPRTPIRLHNNIHIIDLLDPRSPQAMRTPLRIRTVYEPSTSPLSPCEHAPATPASQTEYAECMSMSEEATISNNNHSACDSLLETDLSGSFATSLDIGSENTNTDTDTDVSPQEVDMAVSPMHPNPTAVAVTASAPSESAETVARSTESTRTKNKNIGRRRSVKKPVLLVYSESDSEQQSNATTTGETTSMGPTITTRTTKKEKSFGGHPTHPSSATTPRRILGDISNNKTGLVL